MSRNTFYGAITLLASVLALGMGSACRAELSADARAVIEANKEAIVTVQIVTETTMSYEGESQKRQSKSSATGTIIDPSGLVVTSLTSVNPSDRLRDFMSEEGDGYKTSTKVVDAKIRMDDGTEVPADVVLRDRDLDLAFLKPKKASEKPLKFVDLSQASTPQLLDEIIFLMRLGQVANRSIAADIERISAVLTKPRTSYIVGLSAYMFGYPAFGMDGKPIGLLVLKTSPGKDSDSEDTSMMERMIPVILPCSTVMNAAEQAKTAKPEKAEVTPPAPKPAPKPAAKPTAAAAKQPGTAKPKK